MRHKPHLILVDANAVGYTSMYQPSLSQLKAVDSRTGKQISSAALYGVPKSIMRLRLRYPSATIMLLWDGTDDWRKEIYPEYKGNRLDDEKLAVREAYHKQVPYIRLIVDQMGVPQARCPTSEADDLAGFIVRGLEGSDWMITLYTKDSDWLQIVRDDVTWESIDRNAQIGINDFDKVKYGPFKGPEDYILCKIMAGDVSDNIKGIMGIGMTTAKKHLDSFGSLDNLLDAVSKNEKRAQGKQVLSIANSMDIIERNRLLMDWRYSKPLSPSAMIWHNLYPDDDVLERFDQKSIAQQMAFFSISKELTEQAVRDVQLVMEDAKQIG